MKPHLHRYAQTACRCRKTVLQAKLLFGSSQLKIRVRFYADDAVMSDHSCCCRFIN